MAKARQGAVDFEFRLTSAGMEAVGDEARQLNLDKAEVIRAALAEYFQRRGKTISFAPEKQGGEKRRMTEREAMERVRRHIRALGLPEPSGDFRVGQKRYDLAWPEQRAAVEVSMRKRPADSNGWAVVWIKPDMSDSRMDKALRSLPL